MLFEAHLGVRQGEKGLLTSPVFMESNANCKINFYYHMKGQNIGSLELAIIDETGSKFERRPEHVHQIINELLICLKVY